jgi:hypothetical protein
MREPIEGRIAMMFNGRSAACSTTTSRESRIARSRGEGSRACGAIRRPVNRSLPDFGELGRHLEQDSASFRVRGARALSAHGRGGDGEMAALLIEEHEAIREVASELAADACRGGGTPDAAG